MINTIEYLERAGHLARQKLLAYAKAKYGEGAGIEVGVQLPSSEGFPTQGPNSTVFEVPAGYRYSETSARFVGVYVGGRLFTALLCVNDSQFPV